MTSTMQRKGFNQEMTGELTVDIPSTFLDTTIDWVGENCEPEQVFSRDKLISWAESNGYIKE